MFIVLSSAMQVATQNGHSTNAVQQDLHERILHISKINGGDPVTGKGFTGTSIGTEDGTGETV